jgi:hypothetical protein
MLPSVFLEEQDSAVDSVINQKIRAILLCHPCPSLQLRTKRNLEHIDLYLLRYSVRGKGLLSSCEF